MSAYDAGAARRQHADQQLDGLALFGGSRADRPLVPDPPTGPRAVVPTRDANKYAAYQTWRASADGLAAWAFITAAAREAADYGEPRVSINFVVETLRRRKGIAVNNTYRAWLADDLVAAFPALLALIERRKRGGA